MGVGCHICSCQRRSDGKPEGNLCVPFARMRWEFEVTLHRWHFTGEHRRGLLYECWACVCVRVSVCDLHVSLCDFYAGVCDLPAVLLPQGLESTSGLLRKRQGGWLSANSLGGGT